MLLYIKDALDLEWHKDSLCSQSQVLLPDEIKELEQEYGRELTEDELRSQNIKKIHSIFFPARGESAHTAKAFCSRCPVEMQCLEYSLANGLKFGVWGGAPYRTRRRVLTIRKRVKVDREAGREADI